MIGRLVLSNRNIYKIPDGKKNSNARKCIILSENNDDILIKTNKSFHPRDNYIIIDKENNTILQNLGEIGNHLDDKNIYHELFTLNWMSNSKYNKLWHDYFSNNIAFDLNTSRNDYLHQVITIDPDNSIDLDDGFTLLSDDLFDYLDIHIADPVSYFNFNDENMIKIFDELSKRKNTCYIPNKDNKIIHLLPEFMINKISLLENINEGDYKRAITFRFKISKSNNDIDFNIIYTKLFNIKNKTYDSFDKELSVNKKNNIINLTNKLIDIMNLKHDKITSNNISHEMIEIFMVLVNNYTGNFLQNHKKKGILRTQSNEDSENEIIDLNNIPLYAKDFLNHSANYKIINDNDNNNHFSLGINNYCHISSPMRRFIDMINHLILYDIDYINKIDINFINDIIKKQKKISNAYDLINFINIDNIMKGCVLDIFDNNNILLVVYNETNNFKKIVNVEIPQTTDLIIKKYLELDIQLFYNPNNFKSNKFPFSIKII